MPASSRTPLISVITPVYKCEQYLPQVIDSLLAQNERRWEAVMIDDGSPDNSAKVIKGYAFFEPRIRLLRQDNQGAGAARNNALAEARGEFVLFLDADDWLEPNALRALAEPCVMR